MDRLSDYDYELPSELIASEPAPRREDARLLVIHRDSGTFEHRTICDLPEYLSAGDALVLNDTKVLPARLFGTRTTTGGKWEGLFLSVDPLGNWQLLGQTKGKLQPGETITVHNAHAPDDPETFGLTLLERFEDGQWSARPDSEASHIALLEKFGTMPLPPYMKKPLATEQDRVRYQTTFADRPGSVAAPTAGLHFTPELLEQCFTLGVQIEKVTLHVGIGTFRPIQVERLDKHVMHSEWCELTAETVARLNAIKGSGGRIVAVGTTSVRTLESASSSGKLVPFSEHTDLFIRPPFEFQEVDCLVTNFHLPQSSLLVLVSTFAGLELVREAYQTAIRERYRFFSYGDAMLIL
jgi:S-adenosylmethionine:tRNA ribosyltransferase-isomerase